jgi:protein-S-isoprenylcysteine O-methyltransferase Ste14
MTFAVWAKAFLGKNWGVPMSLKQGHDLITTGPYRIVRHPIYSGILLAQLGSWLASSPVWLFVMSLIYFRYSARVEERLMLQQFPDQYPDFKRRTRGMIIPR